MVIEMILTLFWEYLYDIIPNSFHILNISVNTFLEFL